MQTLNLLHKLMKTPLPKMTEHLVSVKNAPMIVESIFGIRKALQVLLKAPEQDYLLQLEILRFTILIFQRFEEFLKDLSRFEKVQEYEELKQEVFVAVKRNLPYTASKLIDIINELGEAKDNRNINEDLFEFMSGRVLHVLYYIIRHFPEVR